MTDAPETEIMTRELVSLRPGQWKTTRYRAYVLALELDEMDGENTFVEEEIRAIAALLRELIK